MKTDTKITSALVLGLTGAGLVAMSFEIMKDLYREEKLKNDLRKQMKEESLAQPQSEEVEEDLEKKNYVTIE